MSANGVTTALDLNRAARLYEGASDLCPSAAAGYGWCLLTGQGVPIDFTAAADCFQRAADSGDSDGANSLGVCLERGDGVDADIGRAVSYYRMAADRSHREGLYNLGLCLEYGKGIPRDRARAAEYYRRAADLGHPAAENRFGICVECGIGLRSNDALAAHYYQRSAAHGDPDGANNLGFCLEHGRGVRQEIDRAADCYKFAADRGHPEALANYQRCMRLLRRWAVPDRSFDLSVSAPSREDLAEPLIASLDNPGQFDSDNCELKTSIEKFKRSRMPPFLAATKCVRQPLIGRSRSSELRLEACADGTLAVVKSANSRTGEARIEREAAIHALLDHPLVIRVRGFRTQTAVSFPAIVTEFVGRGRLTNHLPLSRANRIAKIVVGIAIAMRHVHSRAVLHRALAPDEILLDWDWSVRIAGFGNSTSPELPALDQPAAPSGDCRYVAPERYENESTWRSDVFSFGFIFYELVVGRRAFPDELKCHQICKLIAVDNVRPDIPDWVSPDVKALITDCWQQDPGDRPPFDEILERLTKLEFKVRPDVNSSKLSEFVQRMTKREENHAAGERESSVSRFLPFHRNGDGALVCGPGKAEGGRG
jgi:serine/threonine protein kinase